MYSMPLRQSIFAAMLIALFASTGASAEQQRHHALSLIGAPKYGRGFSHFDYANPDAPRAGNVRLAAVGGFDSLNPVLFKGDAAAALSLIHQTLMYDSLEEPSTSYGLIAEWVSYPQDFSSVTFGLHKAARWHDGKLITVDDVIFSFEMTKKANPRWAFYYKNVTRAERSGEHEVTFRFDAKGNRELPMIMGQLMVLPKHYWTGTNAKGETRDIMKTTLEPPLGSGPYRIERVEAGRRVVFERVADFWAADLPVNAGHYNFSRISFEYYRDTTVALEAFKADRLDYRSETSSKNWATAYNFKAAKSGWVKREKAYLKRSQPMQGFVFNTRRSKFADPRVRRAFNLAFNFEWANKNLFYGQYHRTSSYFENTELASQGLPQGLELEILNAVRDEVPGEVFTEIYQNPTNAAPRDFRRNLRAAVKLLKEAGLVVQKGVLTNAKTKEAFKVEFLLVSPLFERVVQPFARNLERLGIKTSIRIVDSAQYKRRSDDFDFDVIVGGWTQSHSPGNEQRSYWGSAAANKKGSRNLAGIRNTAIDKLIDKIIFAKDRAELVAASRALDRVLLWNHYVVPQWFVPYERIAYWDRFAHPASAPVASVDCVGACVKAKLNSPKTTPLVSPGFLTLWWYDKTRADKLAALR